MYTTDTPEAMRPTRSARTECCSDPDCGSGLRNNYFEGKRLTPDTFRVEHSYSAERRRLLNRAIHGWGVVYGYHISADPPSTGTSARVARRLKVGAGLALDECGRELVELGTDRLDIADVIFIDDKGRCIPRANAFKLAEASGHREGRAAPACWQLSVHYAEQDRDPVQITDSCRCQQQEWDHVCETVRYTLRLIPCDDCCDDHDCELTCDCASGRCCHHERTTEKEEISGDEQWRAELPPGRGGCRCLCDHLTKLNPGDGCEHRLCEIKEECGRVRVDLKHGVPLACVAVWRDECQEWTFGSEVDACGPRRLVKRNDLLFDLIRGCDLTRISEIGWSHWHRRESPVPFSEFSAALGSPGQGRRDYVTRDFWVRFSRPVRRKTVRPDCFTMTALSEEREGGWWQVFRVPIVAVDTSVIPPEAGDPADHVRGARIVVDGAWIEDAVRGRRSVFQDDETTIEIEVRGDFILDCNGQAVDANAIGLSTARTGNGSPGGTFMSGFRVSRTPDAPDRAEKQDNTDRLQGVSS